MATLSEDPRVDPRIKQLMDSMPPLQLSDVTDRQQLLEEANHPKALARAKEMEDMFELVDNEQVAPSDGLHIATHEFISQPDGNTIKVQFIRPDSDDVLPCVYYIHGGGMQSMSCFYGIYRAWGKFIARQGIAGSDGGFSQLPDAVVGGRGCPFPGRVE